MTLTPQCIVEDGKIGLNIYTAIISGLWFALTIVHRLLVGRMVKASAEFIWWGIQVRFYFFACGLATAVFLFAWAIVTCGLDGIDKLTLVWVPVAAYVATNLREDLDLVPIAQRGYSLLQAAEFLLREPPNVAPFRLVKARQSIASGFEDICRLEITKASIAFAHECSIRVIGGREAWETIAEIFGPLTFVDEDDETKLELGTESVEENTKHPARWENMGKISRILI